MKSIVKTMTLLLALLLISISSGCASEIDGSSGSSYDGSYPLITFNAQIPIDIDATSKIKIAGSFNGWDPFASGYELVKNDSRHYSMNLAFDSDDVGVTLEYKYVLILQGQASDPWQNVEGSATGGEIANRRYTINIGAQTVNDTIQSFKNNIAQSSITRGTLEKITLTMTEYEPVRTRTIRIWLPDGYDSGDTSKRYGVLYMHDGQNLFDRYTSFAGEWEVDEAIGAMMDNGYVGAIVVGIDNSSDRLNELSPTWPRSAYGSPVITDPTGEKYAAFIVDTVKPYVDSHYNTNSSREATGIGGSSMGGNISFFMALTYADVFGYGLLFSSAMQVYTQDTTATFLDSLSLATKTNLPRLYIYAGGLEPTITPYVAIIHDELIARGYPAANLAREVDQGKGHNEAAWAQYFPIALAWLLGID